MNPNLKIVLLCLGASLGTVPALRADDAPPPPPPPANQGHGWGGGNRAERMEKHMAKELNLTADQQSKWDALGQAERQALEALHNDDSVPRDQKREKMRGILTNFQGQRRALLNSDQQAKFDEMVAKMKEHMHERHDGQDGPPPPPPPPPPQSGT